MNGKVDEKELLTVIKGIFETMEFTDNDFYLSILSTKENILETFFDSYFSRIEKGCCCHDKSSFTVKKIYKALETKENINLIETYREYKNRGGYIGGITELDEICYWCPRTIKDTDTAIKLMVSYMTFDFKTFNQIINGDKNE